jgi:hypothetical protein
MQIARELKFEIPPVALLSFSDEVPVFAIVGLSEKFIVKSIGTLTGKLDRIETLVKYSYLNRTRQQQLGLTKPASHFRCRMW